MDQGYATRELFFVGILLISFEVFGSENGRKRLRSLDGESISSDERSRPWLHSDGVAGRGGDNAVLVDAISPGDSQLSEDDRSSSSVSEVDWSYDTTDLVVGHVPVPIFHGPGQFSVRDQYNSRLEEQRIRLLQMFCQATKISFDKEFLNYVERYRSRANVTRCSYQQLKTSCLELGDVCAHVRQDLSGEGMFVESSSSMYLNDPQVCLAVLDRRIILYAPFFQASVAKQIAELRKCAENVKAGDSFLFTRMNYFLRSQQNMLSEQEAQRASSLLQVVNFFCARSAGIKAFFSEDREDVKEVLVKECCAPINYMQELVRNVEEEDRLKWEYLLSEDRLREYSSRPLSAPTVVDEYPGIPIAWAIRIIVARGNYALRQRDAMRAQQARQRFLEQQQLLAQQSPSKMRKPRAKKG